MPCLEGGLHRLKADPSARADDENRRHGFMLHGRTRLAHHHVRCRQPHRKIVERLADKAAHALPASGAAGAPAATRAPAATGAHKEPQEPMLVSIRSSFGPSTPTAPDCLRNLLRGGL